MTQPLKHAFRTHPRWVFWWPGSWFIGQRQRKFRRENEFSGRNPFVLGVDINDTYQIPSIHLQKLFGQVVRSVSGLFRWFISIIVYSYIYNYSWIYVYRLFVCVSKCLCIPTFLCLFLSLYAGKLCKHTHKNTTYSSIVMLDKIDYIYAYICIYIYIYCVHRHGFLTYPK